MSVLRLCRRRVRGKRRHHRYAVLDEDDDDKLESMEMLPKGGTCPGPAFSLGILLTCH